MNPTHIPAIVILIMATGFIYYMIHYEVLPPAYWEEEQKKKGKGD